MNTITKEVKEEIISAIIQTWEAIGGDIMANEAEMGYDIVHQDLVIEMVLDADRILNYGDISEETNSILFDMPYADKINIAKEALPQKEWQ